MRLILIMLTASIACGCASSSSPPKKGGMSNAMNVLRGKTPLAAVKMMEDTSSPDNRRQGIYQLAQYEFGQSETYCKRYRQIAQSDPDFIVRAAAVRALNWSRDKNAVPVFIAALADKSEQVRWQAAKGLANVPDSTALDALAKALGNANETIDVRIAVADALRHYRDFTAARALVATLDGKDFSIAWQARRSLREITGNDFRYDERAWLEYLTTAKLG